MKQVKALFAPLIGQLVWQVRRGHGSFLTMKFGVPHLSVVEPIIASPGRSEKVRRLLGRRRVFVSGDWHLWVQYGDWELVTADGLLTSSDIPGSLLDECLADLEGQRLVFVDEVKPINIWTLRFDPGGILKIWRSNEIADDL